MAGISLSTAGVVTQYAVETVAGTMPTADYIKIPDIKEIPELNPAPATYDSSTFDNKVYKTSINGLKDLGGALALKANLTQEFKTAWEALITAYEAGATESKATYLNIEIPGLVQSLYIKIEPSTLGLPSLSTDSLIETSVYFTPLDEPKWDTKATAAG